MMGGKGYWPQSMKLAARCVAIAEGRPNQYFDIGKLMVGQICGIAIIHCSVTNASGHILVFDPGNYQIHSQSLG